MDGKGYETIEEIEVPGSIYIEKRFGVERVPTIAEVNDFFRLLAFGTRWHAWYSVAFLCGLRPCELAKLTTDMVVVDPATGRWVGLTYEVGKARPPGMPKKGEAPRKAVRKHNRILERRGDFPPGALDSLKLYWINERGMTIGKLFPCCYSQYRNEFGRLRRKMIALGHARWAETSEEYYRHIRTKRGKTYCEFDINAYSARRWFVSTYHWLKTPINYVPDIIKTQKRMAHSGFKDTQTYIATPEELGLPPEQIGKGWKVLIGQSPGQLRMNEYW